jgi:hypothetical protein
VAFYVYVLRPPVWASLSVVVGLALMTFVPARYLYITRGGPFAKGMIAGGAAWAVLSAIVLLLPAANRRTPALVSLIYPMVYLTLSWIVTLRRLRVLNAA